MNIEDATFFVCKSLIGVLSKCRCYYIVIAIFSSLSLLKLLVQAQVFSLLVLIMEPPRIYENEPEFREACAAGSKMLFLGPFC